MKLKCKAGDLVIIAKALPQYSYLIGKIATCVKLEVSLLHGPWWDLDFNVHGQVASAHDEDLIPIRDQPGADESLSWASVPLPAILTEGT